MKNSLIHEFNEARYLSGEYFIKWHNTIVVNRKIIEYREYLKKAFREDIRLEYVVNDVFSYWKDLEYYHMIDDNYYIRIKQIQPAASTYQIQKLTKQMKKVEKAIKALLERPVEEEVEDDK